MCTYIYREREGGGVHLSSHSRGWGIYPLLGGGEGECPGPNDQWVGPTTSALSACSFSGSQIFPASVTSTRRDAPVRLDRLPLFFHGSQLCGACSCKSGPSKAGRASRACFGLQIHRCCTVALNFVLDSVWMHVERFA